MFARGQDTPESMAQQRVVLWDSRQVHYRQLQARRHTALSSCVVWKGGQDAFPRRFCVMAQISRLTSGSWRAASPVSKAAECAPGELTPAEFQHLCSFLRFVPVCLCSRASTEPLLIFHHGVSVSFLTDGFACIFPG